MAKLIIERENNFMIRFRALKVYVDGVFVDHIEPNDKSKVIEIADDDKEVRLKVDWCYSNKLHLNKSKSEPPQCNKVRVTSQIQNGLFILIFSSLFIGGILWILKLIGPYWYLISFLPMLLIVGWQIFGRNNYLRLTKISK
ncbi:hypothetical protein [Leptobacterium sp. I13]|uniref:hypothetical protein n=1 Tax=Leptobacterium meishanense TaxID=3128904 RepID=UPI0030EE27D9